MISEREPAPPHAGEVCYDAIITLCHHWVARRSEGTGGRVAERDVDVPPHRCRGAYRSLGGGSGGNGGSARHDALVGMGDEAEAVVYAAAQMAVWRATPGALD